MKMSAGVVLADFFSGCGGSTRGFADAGIEPVLAIDWDSDAAATYRLNFPETTFLERDILSLSVDEVEDALPPRGESIRLFAGCAPCQPFSGHRHGPTALDKRSFLLLEFLRFVKASNPELIFVENVPGMQRLSTSRGPLAEFVDEVSKTHDVSVDIISSADYGIPQTRRRLVLVASRLGPIKLPLPTHGLETGEPHSTIRDWIGSLPPIEAGQEDSEISNHRAMMLSDLNLKRIRATPEGGDRRDWPRRLWPDCHQGGFDGHTDVYGRLRWDSPAPTLTTKCLSYSNGRFGHPSQDRALSAREAARLQTFPNSFRFTGSLTSQGKQIGNAVPVLLAEHFGRHLMNHVAEMRRIGSISPRDQSGKVAADIGQAARSAA
jgi:DNA (cytosine-5)-methyltransferase 1